MTESVSKLDLPALFNAARHGKGVRLVGQLQLEAFASYVASRDEVIRNVETYELRGDLEIPRIDLGLYQGSAEEAALPAPTRLAASTHRLGEMIADTNTEGLHFVFDVWTDENI